MVSISQSLHWHQVHMVDAYPCRRIAEGTSPDVPDFSSFLWSLMSAKLSNRPSNSKNQTLQLSSVHCVSKSCFPIIEHTLGKSSQCNHRSANERTMKPWCGAEGRGDLATVHDRPLHYKGQGKTWGKVPPRTPHHHTHTFPASPKMGEIWEYSVHCARCAPSSY